jgi:hypothetical protein
MLREPDADNEMSAIQNIDGVVALLDLISVELLEMVECFLLAELVDRLIELYEAAGYTTWRKSSSTSSTEPSPRLTGNSRSCRRTVVR